MRVSLAFTTVTLVFHLFFCSAAMSEPKNESINDHTVRLSGGLGIIYGGLGLKGELRLIQSLTLSIGAGLSAMDSYDGADYGSGVNGAAAIGFFYYPPVEMRKWFPRFGLSYGENQWHGFVNDLEANPDYLGESSGKVADNGISLSSGFIFQIGKHLSLEADLSYAIRGEKTTSALEHSSAWQFAAGVGISWSPGSGKPKPHGELQR